MSREDLQRVRELLAYFEDLLILKKSVKICSLLIMVMLLVLRSTIHMMYHKACDK